MAYREANAIIIGAGASGMMCALTAAAQGRAVILIDHAAKLAEKIRISGGGRCNFTNFDIKPDNYLSQNPHFCRSALSRYTPDHFIALLKRHGIGFHEKMQGQLFCDEGSETIINMLKQECDKAGVQWCMPCKVEHIARQDTGFMVDTTRGQYRSDTLVIASGGLSIPKIGATPFGYRVAEQFGIAVNKLKPGLVPLSFHPQEWEAYSELAGVSLQAEVGFGKKRFRDDLLFTHRGLSGPAILQISSYWEPGKPLTINLLPDQDVRTLLMQQRQSKMLLVNLLAQYLPKRLADLLVSHWASNKPLNQCSDKEINALAEHISLWQITPSGTLGYGKAEVTCGGVDTRAISSKTMECNDVPGLFFIGEVLDVTGQLGGYNFHWAWASGHAAGLAIAERS